MHGTLSETIRLVDHLTKEAGVVVKVMEVENHCAKATDYLETSKPMMTPIVRRQWLRLEPRYELISPMEIISMAPNATFGISQGIHNTDVSLTPINETTGYLIKWKMSFVVVGLWAKGRTNVKAKMQKWSLLVLYVTMKPVWLAIHLIMRHQLTFTRILQRLVPKNPLYSLPMITKLLTTAERLHTFFIVRMCLCQTHWLLASQGRSLWLTRILSLPIFSSMS